MMALYKIYGCRGNELILLWSGVCSETGVFKELDRWVAHSQLYVLVRGLMYRVEIELGVSLSLVG